MDDFLSVEQKNVDEQCFSLLDRLNCTDKEKIVKVFPADRDEWNNVAAFLDEELEKHDAGMKASMQLAIALEEMFVNVASYAYEGVKGDCEITLIFYENNVEVYLRDSGMFFDPLAKEDPDITLAAEDRQIGGLGILMVKKTMDEVAYVRANNENIFMMRKVIN